MKATKQQGVGEERQSTRGVEFDGNLHKSGTAKPKSGHPNKPGGKGKREPQGSGQLKKGVNRKPLCKWGG